MKSKKKQIIKLEFASVEFCQLKDGRVKATVTKNYFNEDQKWQLWFPEASKARHGMIDSEIFRARLLHDYCIEIGHYSVTMTWEK